MYRTQSQDTDRETEERMFARYRTMSAREKFEHIEALGRLLQAVALADLRARYPGAGEDEHRLRLASRHLDRETMMRVYSWDPDQQGR